jgi:serine/threonine-protein kinase haspin
VSSRKSASTTDARLPMDHLVHGVKATVIDLGLARMDAGDGSTDIRWTPFDEEIFEGEG